MPRTVYIRSPPGDRELPISTAKNATMKFAKTVIFNFLAFLVSSVLTIAALLLCLKLFDVYLLSLRHPALAAEVRPPTAHILSFTGGYIQAYKHERGKLAWSNFYDDFDVASGEYGFFIDFRLEAPPPKQDNEIRIVLTVGSTAQGSGGAPMRTCSISRAASKSTK